MDRALEKISHRGPDGWAKWDTGNILLGHRRLSIIDLSATGAQPFVDSSRGLAITFNGEIYNYQEIREVLIAKGYEFRSQSDTEVILLAYDCFGENFLSCFRGMFAFCLFDQRRNVVLLARDPMGEKPLFYYLDREKFVFASEIKAFHAFPEIPLDIDVESVRAYLSLQYIPDPHTAYQQVKRLPAGAVMRIDLHQWEVARRNYWRFDERSDLKRFDPEKIEALMARSVRERLIADVEVGLLLSGGIDSTLLACYAKNSNANLRVFSARFDQPDLDELEYSTQVARQLNLNHVVVDGGKLDGDAFDRIIFHADEFLGDPACVPTYLLAQEISKHVKVVLSGEGADELFWGYDTYRYERWWKWIAWLQPFLSRLKSIQNLVGDMEFSPRAPASFTRVAKMMTETRELGASRWTSVFSSHAVDQLILSELKRSGSAYLSEMEESVLGLTRLFGRARGSLAVDLQYWLPSNLLVKVDRMTMAHGVEARAPFLDSDLVMAVIAMPSNQKMNLRQGKLYLRSAVEKHFPGELGRMLARRRKHGFEVPVREWLLTTLREQVEDRLSKRSLDESAIFDSAQVSRLWKSFLAAPADSPLRRKVWLIFCYQSWHELHRAKFGF
jgi:asparagine synthase (glutamine-hydrolysing)